METIYYNGDILTMEGAEYPQAVLTRDGIIAAVGDYKTLTGAAPGAARFDLEGNTLMPAFLDAHSHITALAQTMHLVQLSGATSMDELQALLKRGKEKLNLKPGQWLIGFGYDHNNLKEKKHPDNRILDEASRENPILISHASGHMGVVNSLALRELSIQKNTPDPDGGKIGRASPSGEPTGYLEENAFLRVSQHMPEPSLDLQCAALEQAQQVYLSHGISTIQDGITNRQRMNLLARMAGEGRLKADIVAYADLKNDAALAEEYAPYRNRYQRHLKLGGFKIFLDGSPQGKTAWLSQPYLGSPDYCGYPIYTGEEVKEFAQTALRQHMQLLAHCNGDAAAQQFLDAYQAAWETEGKPSDSRPVMIHAQILRGDQLPRLQALGMIPSFFVAHTHYWGDVHIQNLGFARARAISPAASAQKLGIPFTFHQDTPVLEPNMLDTIWCAVNRQTKSGAILEGERISAYDACKAVTIHAAYQYFEENSKGSIRTGKQASFAVLSHNPCKVEPMAIRDIRVLQTILRDKPVYQRHGK